MVRQTEIPVTVEEMYADVILVTHGHADHFGDTMELANRTGALVVSNHELSVYLSKQGFDCIRVGYIRILLWLVQLQLASFLR